MFPDPGTQPEVAEYFPPESKASGLGDNGFHPVVWYRRTFRGAATVGDETITVGELYRQKEAYSRFSQGQSFPAKMMLNSIISGRIGAQAAKQIILQKIRDAERRYPA